MPSSSLFNPRSWCSSGVKCFADVPENAKEEVNMDNIELDLS